MNKRMTKRVAVLAVGIAAALAMMLGLAGCDAAPATKAQEYAAAVEAGEPGYHLVTDSCGREVALPEDVESIACSGAYAQVLMASLAPERMASLSSEFDEADLQYFGEELGSLPVIGQYYGKNASMNYEELIKIAPDVVIDIGERKNFIDEDMDGLQDQTGIPAIHIDAELPQIPEAYRTLGGVLGCEEKAEQLATYIEDVFAYAAERRDEVAARGVKVLYTSGDNGDYANAAGTVHGAVLDLVGVENVADLGSVASTQISPEQVMNWAPDVWLLANGEGFFDKVYDDAVWENVPAVANGRVYEVPGTPYEFLNRPPSIQQALGVLWLGNFLFPDIYDFDIVEKMQEFYQLFWDYDLSREEAEAMLANANGLLQE